MYVYTIDPFIDFIAGLTIFEVFSNPSHRRQDMGFQHVYTV